MIFFYLSEGMEYEIFSRSGKSQGIGWMAKNMKFFPGQGKVRELGGWPRKFRKDLENQGKVRE